MYHHILVCFDNSDGSRKALEIAANLYLLNPNCQLSVVQVINGTSHSIDTPLPEDSLGKSGYTAIPRSDGGVYATHLPPEHSIQENTKHFIQDDEPDLHAEVDEILQPKGISFHFDTLYGKTSENICEYSESNQVDLIVVGQSEEGIFKRIFLGSTEENIIKNTTRDVLVVK